MVSAYIPVELRRLVRERDRYRCCYCLTTELNCGMRMVREDGGWAGDRDDVADESWSDRGSAAAMG